MTDSKAPLNGGDIEAQIVSNSLSALASSLCNTTNLYQQGAQLSQTDTLYINNRWYLVSNQRQLLSELYVEHGIVQTLVDQPVDDAFRAGFEIKTGQLSADEVEKVQIYCEREGVIRAITQALKWTRLYGGGGILIITEQDPKTPLNIEQLTDKSRIEFRSVDMWELYYSKTNIYSSGAAATLSSKLSPEEEFYDYYGQKVHRSRVYTIAGKEPPSFIRPRLRGWGMSELERLVRSINQYLKNQDVVFELLDEAKIDIYKIKGFTSALLNPAGTQQISTRIQGANLIKNFQNALTMDKEDDYEQKQIAFSGLGEILIQIRQGIAADLKMPVTKLFGISSAGFNSGEDDIENYNSMIEGEIRGKVKYIVVDMLSIACQKVLGFVPDDLQIIFPPLRILSALDEEKVKDHQFNRTMSAYQSGLIPDAEAKESINKDSLLPVEIDETISADEPINGDFTTATAGGEGNTGKSQ